MIEAFRQAFTKALRRTSKDSKANPKQKTQSSSVVQSKSIDCSAIEL
jgi:hypothetical protein